MRVEKNGEYKVTPKLVGLLKSGTVAAADGASDVNKGFVGDGGMKSSEICCYRLEARLLADCSGGNSRLSYLLGVGGGHFLIKESDHRYRAAHRDRTTSAIADHVRCDRRG